MTKHKIETELVFVPIENLSVVWAQSQRPYNENWSKKIASDFDTDKFDPPVITKPNGAGHYHVVEGQHRIKAAEMAFGPKEQLGCRLVDAEDPARAAEIWLGINSGRKAISPVQKFTVAVTARREPETEINAMVNKMGYRISSTKADYCISAVSALMDIHKRFGKATLQATLSQLDTTWPGDAQGFSGELIKGYGTFINEFRHFSHKRLAEMISKGRDAFSPGRLLIACRAYKEQRKESLCEAVVETLLSKYNRGLKDDQKLRHK